MVNPHGIHTILSISLLFIVTLKLSAQTPKAASTKPVMKASTIKYDEWAQTLAARAIASEQNRGGKGKKSSKNKRSKGRVGSAKQFLLHRQLFREFPSLADQQLMLIEQTDGIWLDFLTQAASYQNLAAKYAEKSGSFASQAQKISVKTWRDVAKVRNVYYHYKTESHITLTEHTLNYVQKSRKLPVLSKAFSELKKKLSEATANQNWLVSFKELSALRRKILFSHPELDLTKLIVNKHSPGKYSHNCDQYLGRHSRSGPGLGTLKNWKLGPLYTPLLKNKLPNGDTNHPTLHFDAERVIFGFTDHSKPPNARVSHIYEAATDGSWVKQLTGTASDKRDTIGHRSTAAIEDFDPCYLPEDGIIFTSTRCQNFGRCHGSRYTPSYLLYKAGGDGSNIHPISYGEANEHFPSVLNDGRIVFTRWEYNNRNQIALHKLWSIRPDGTGISNFYGVNSATPWAINYHTYDDHSAWYADIPEAREKKYLPYMISQTRAIPNSQKVVATACAHHAYTTGTLVIVDPEKGEDGFEPIFKLTPEIDYPEAGGWHHPGAYMTPMPVSEQLFFAAYTPNPIEQQKDGAPLSWGHAIVLIDIFGGREFIYRDPEISTVSPLPLVKRKRPPIIPSALPEVADGYGTLIVQDVYKTRNDPERVIKRGDIKALRVIEVINQPTPRKMFAGENDDFARKILGTVPVHEDGSVIFKVPAGKPIYIQTLDENHMALMTERTLFHVMPGETRSCVGCHEPAGTPPVSTAPPIRRPPLNLEPPAGPQYNGGFSFKRTVQPVLDRYCISCHGLNKQVKSKVNLLGALGKTRPMDYIRGKERWTLKANYANSYKSLVTHPGMAKMAIRKSNTGPRSETVNSRPKDYFSHAGKLLPMLMNGHHDIKLDRESLERIASWADLNYIRYGNYDAKTKTEWHIPDKKAVAELRSYIKTVFGDELASQPIQSLVNIAQPDESRILKAPLSLKAGGWGQIGNGWSTTNDSRYQKMKALVDACTTE